MDPVNRLAGSDGCQIVVGTGTTVYQGFNAFACTVRVDGTQIIYPVQFSGISLNQGEYISFGGLINRITLNSPTNSVTLWLQSTYVPPVWSVFRKKEKTTSFFKKLFGRK